MSVMASQITGISIFYLTVCSGADERKHQISASLGFVRRIHRWPVNSPHKGPVTGKIFPFHYVIMTQHDTKFLNDEELPWLPFPHYMPWSYMFRCNLLGLGTSRFHPWWRHQMEAFSTLLALYVGIHRSAVNSHHKRPVMRTRMFLWCGSTQAVKQTVEWPVFKNSMTFIWRHRNDYPPELSNCNSNNIKFSHCEWSNHNEYW